MPIAPLRDHQQALLKCRACPNVHPPVICGQPNLSPIYMLGQAPGPHEGKYGKPFAYTAGKTLFRWYGELGVSEEAFRQRVYIAAVLRCFPGKAISKGGRSGGDRVPSKDEIARCQPWIQAELDLLKPKLIIAIGRLAIEQVLPRKPKKLADVVGASQPVTFLGHQADCIPLPHPSGVSSWPRTEPGKTLLAQALQCLGEHPAWRETFAS